MFGYLDQRGSGVSRTCVSKEFRKISFCRNGLAESQEENFSTYKIYEDIHEFEEYIDTLVEHFKYSLLDFRTGYQKMPVNCRSELSIPRQEHMCTKCWKRILGGEFHFQFECTCNGIEKLRISVIIKYSRTRCSTLKMTQLLNTNDRKLLIKVAKFVYLGMKEYAPLPDVVSEKIDNVDLNCLYN